MRPWFYIPSLNQAELELQTVLQSTYTPQRGLCLAISFDRKFHPKSEYQIKNRTSIFSNPAQDWKTGCSSMAQGYRNPDLGKEYIHRLMTSEL